MTVTYKYKGYDIYRITRKDWCVYNESKTQFIIDALTLKQAKEEIDKL